MNSDKVYDVVAEQTLSESLLYLNENVEFFAKNTKLLTYDNPLLFVSDAAQITFEQLVKKLPAKSILIFDASKTTYPRLDILGSGLVSIVRSTHKGKAHIEFYNEKIQLYRMYNDYYASNPLQPWKARGACSFHMSAADLSNLIANIPIDGSSIYVFTEEAEKITDKPAGIASGGFNVRTIWFNGAVAETEQILTENGRVGRAWRRVRGAGRGYNEWMAIPMVIRGLGQKWYVRAGDMYVDDDGATFLMTNTGLVAIQQ